MIQFGFSPAGLPVRRTQASAFAGSAAPEGYVWEFVTTNGVLVLSGNEPVVALVRI